MTSVERSLWNAYASTRSIDDRNALVGYYWPYLNILANRLCARGRTLESFDAGDLAAEGVPALIERVESFDLARGFEFSTYAQKRLVGSMLDAVRSSDWVPRLERTIQRADPEHRIPQMSPLDEARDIEGPAARNQTEADEFWEQCCRGMSFIERMAFLLYWRGQLTMDEIGTRLGLSQSRISQILKPIPDRLRRAGIES